MGQNINYTLTVANTNGPDTAHDVAVVDTLPDGLTFVSAVPSPDYQSGHTLAWNVDTLEYGQTKQIQMVTSVSTLLHIGDALMNFATVSTTDNDPIINNNVDFVVTQVGDGKSADLGILSMQVIDSEVHTNETTSINMEIENAGPDTAKNAVLEFNIPSGVTIQSVSPTPTSTTATKLTRNL